MGKQGVRSRWIILRFLGNVWHTRLRRLRYGGYAVNEERTFWQYGLIAGGVICIDQLSKLWVHFNMDMGPSGTIVLLGNWLKVQYVLNPGMAFGVQLGGAYGKLLLTMGRMMAAYVITRHIRYLVQTEYRPTLPLGAGPWCWAAQ